MNKKETKINSIEAAQLRCLELEKRLCEICDALGYDPEVGSCGAYTIDDENYKASWFSDLFDAYGNPNWSRACN